MEERSCDHGHCCTHTTNQSVCQTLSEMDWERGIWNAASTGDFDKVKSIINKSQNVLITVNEQDNFGYTALHYASRKGHIDICKLLIKSGAKVDAKTKGVQSTPLHKAALGGKLENVKLLLEHGASIKFQDAEGQTVLHKAVDNKHFDLANKLVEICPELKNIPDYKGVMAMPQK